MPRRKGSRSTGSASAGTGRFSLLYTLALVAMILFGAGLYAVSYSNVFSTKYTAGGASALGGLIGSGAATTTSYSFAPLDTADYDRRLMALAHLNLATTTATSTATSTVGMGQAAQKRSLWPVKTDYPAAGAILPFKRIVAYYGNFYSKGMGVLGEYSHDQVLAKLKAASAEWTAADPATPVLPAIEYIVVTAQGYPGKDGKYRLRMPDSEINKALAMAHEVNGIVILDFQVGLSNLQNELPLYAKYLAMPEVHLAIDPEFSMKTGAKPGTVIGTMSAVDVNYAANFLSALVKANNLPPKVLIVHRFTEDMVTNYREIKPLPEVQIVMNMDGWGFGAKKINTYNTVVAPEPVEFTGFKLFYKNDLKPPSTRLLTPSEVLDLTPAPIYIQYQ